MIPSVDACFSFMEKYKMFDHIKDHSVVVARVAKLLSTELYKKGFNISSDKIVAGALMHDIAKTECISTNKDHATKGWKICINEGLHEIADMVREHVILKNYSSTAVCWEKEIVCYADKRVKHDKVVSLDERMDYILWRYGKNDEKLCGYIRENFKIYNTIEKKLFSFLNFMPDELSEQIKDIQFNDEKNELRLFKTAALQSTSKDESINSMHL
ncbi:Metal-dependent phosphohydrolase [Candidatus Magnetomoraceae bacterium gMMP-15]